MKVTFEAHGTTYILSTDHARSSYGTPVLVTASGDQLGPWDVIHYSRYASWTARAIAGLLDTIKPIGSDKPYTDDPAIQTMVRKFEAVKG